MRKNGEFGEVSHVTIVMIKQLLKNIYFGVNASIETKAIVAKLASELNKDVLFHFMEFNKNPIKLIFKR
ncbi:MAG: hypothetical protein IPO23_11460 [Flavobacterium sp.]|jgi:hypothetical protein|nr:hypothetical protein [Flavobacterium sp.]